MSKFSIEDSQSRHDDQTGPSLAAPSSQEEYKVVCVRLRTAELQAFSEEISRYGLTNSMALRIVTRRIAGFLEVDLAVRRLLEAQLERIGEMSCSMRTLHEDYVSGGVVDLSALEEQRSVFGEAFTELDACLRTILNVSKRRTDGRRMLSEALQ